MVAQFSLKGLVVKFCAPVIGHLVLMLISINGFSFRRVLRIWISFALVIAQNLNTLQRFKFGDRLNADHHIKCNMLRNINGFRNKFPANTYTISLRKITLNFPFFSSKESCQCVRITLSSNCMGNKLIWNLPWDKFTNKMIGISFFFFFSSFCAYLFCSLLVKCLIVYVSVEQQCYDIDAICTWLKSLEYEENIFCERKWGQAQSKWIKNVVTLE